jgi:hypothetical protein
METDNLVLEMLRNIRKDIARMADDIKAMRAELTSTRLHGSAIGILQDQDHSEIAHLKDRVDRIEVRLGLVDEG